MDDSNHFKPGLIISGQAWKLQTSPVRASDLCVVHLQLIEAAKAQWALEKQKTARDVPTWADILDYACGRPLDCPKGGKYTIGKLGDAPTCSIGGPEHSLP